MAAPVFADPHSTPLNVLFPEHYEASKRMIALDFLFLGSVVIGSIVLGAFVSLAATS